MKRWLARMGATFQLGKGSHFHVTLNGKISVLPMHPSKELKKGTVETQVVDALNGSTAEQQLQWLMLLGHDLTVAAQSFCETGTLEAEGRPLRGFNEIHHHLYQQLSHLIDGTAWPIGKFVSDIRATSKTCGIEGEVYWAVTALCRIFLH